MTLGNLVLAVSAVSAAYVWRRAGYRVPRGVPVPAKTSRRLLVVAGGCTLVVFLGYAAGEIIGGRAEVSPTAPRYASRATEPRKFWGKVLPNIGVALAVGGSLIAFGVRDSEQPRGLGGRSPAAASRIPPSAPSSTTES